MAISKSAALASSTWARARTLSAGDALEWYKQADELYGFDTQHRRELVRRDLFYLMAIYFARVDMCHPWLYKRVREVEVAKDGYLDLWAREHRKSTVITFGATVQDILASHGDEPLAEWQGIEPTFGIFSHTRPTAKKFLRQIKAELEQNRGLKDLFPDILYENPERDAPKWSEDAGIIVRRRTPTKESTVEAWGLVDGQPTGAHFNVRIYDDVISRAGVNTPEMILQATEAWEHSINLGVEDGGRERYIGTRYAIMDTYSVILERGAAKARIYPSTEDGTPTGKPVLFSVVEHEKRRRAMGPTTFNAQMLQKPLSKGTATFDVEHLQFLDVRPKTLNVYILGDPAHSKRKGSDRTAFAVIGMDAQSNKYLLDGYNHRMNLAERWEALKSLRKRWINEPGVQGVLCGYERYGLQSDLEHFESEMRRDGNAFDIVELAWPREGPGAKTDRIGRMRPDFQNKHFFLPLLAYRDGGDLCYMSVVEEEVKFQKAIAETKRMRDMKRDGQMFRIMRPIKRIDEEGRLYDLTVRFITEYLSHPAPGATDDLIDATSRIYDIDARPPILIDEKDLEPEVFLDT